MKRRYAIMVAFVSVFSTSLSDQTFAQSDETIRRALELVRQSVESCRRAQPECGGGPLPRWAHSAWVQDEHRAILYRGGCLMDAHSHWNFRGPDRNNSGRKAYLEIVAIAAARGALACGICPPDSYWNSEEGKDLDSRLANVTAEVGGWYDFKRRCRPDRSAQARPPRQVAPWEPETTEGRVCRKSRPDCSGSRNPGNPDEARRYVLQRARCSGSANESLRGRDLGVYRDVLRTAIIRTYEQCHRCPPVAFWASEDGQFFLNKPGNPSPGTGGSSPGTTTANPEYFRLVDIREECRRQNR